MSIPHNRPLITDADRARVAAVLESGWIAQGPQVKALEAAFVGMHGGGAACAVSSGTAALFLALRGAGVGPGDAVAVPTYSCSALLNAVNMTGGVPLPVDVKADDFTLDAAAVERQAGAAKAEIAVHCFGASADVDALARSGRIVIEDCCQSLGGPQGRSGAAAVYSFYASKIVTGGQGGLVTDPRGAIAEAARDYREFDGRDTYEPRFNLQTTDMSAALVLSQFERLDAIRARRRAIRAAYMKAASALLAAGFAVQQGLDADDHLPHRFVLLAPDGARRERLRAHLAAAGVGTIVPIERFELLHRYLGLDPAAFPVAEHLAATALSLPLYPGLADDEVATVCAALECAP